jgi:hypothetical protein
MMILNVLIVQILSSSYSRRNRSSVSLESLKSLIEVQSWAEQLCALSNKLESLAEMTLFCEPLLIEASQPSLSRNEIGIIELKLHDLEDIFLSYLGGSLETPEDFEAITLFYEVSRLGIIKQQIKQRVAHYFLEIPKPCREEIDGALFLIMKPNLSLDYSIFVQKFMQKIQPIIKILKTVHKILFEEDELNEEEEDVLDAREAVYLYMGIHRNFIGYKF